jgi:hypothetical protein
LQQISLWQKNYIVAKMPKLPRLHLPKNAVVSAALEQEKGNFCDFFATEITLWQMQKNKV